MFDIIVGGDDDDDVYWIKLPQVRFWNFIATMAFGRESYISVFVFFSVLLKGECFCFFFLFSIDLLYLWIGNHILHEKHQTNFQVFTSTWTFDIKQIDTKQIDFLESFWQHTKVINQILCLSAKRIVEFYRFWFMIARWVQKTAVTLLLEGCVNLNGQIYHILIR